MTKGGSGKPKMLGRLIFGEKRRQHTSLSRHRSVTQNGGSTADVSKSGANGDSTNKTPLNLHDWAVWRMQLNEQMGNGLTERTDLKQMRQFLHSNSFYQQHSRDPSNGRYNGVRLLFSIPRAKINPELLDESRGRIKRNTSVKTRDTPTYDQHNARPNSDDRTTTSVNSVSASSPILSEKTISQLLPKNLIGNTGSFLRSNEQMVTADSGRTRRSIRTPYSAADRVHSTLQKAVKDGNVLEKIKAFEMQAAAAQAESTAKLGSSGMTSRMHSVASSAQSTTHRTLSPVTMHSIQHPISPVPTHHESQQQQYIRSHRNRYVHPTQHRRDGNVGRESRKGAHVLEPAHGDIILKRRTPSQKTANDEDYSISAISSMALTAPQGHHHHRQHHHQHRTSASRSRHRQEPVHDKRPSHNHDNTPKKHQQKPKESSTKPSARRLWLKGHKETPTESIKQDVPPTKSSKTKKNKKTIEQDKATSPTPKGKPSSSSSDNNRVYGVPHTTINEYIKSEKPSPQPPSRIEEENESDREEKTTHTSPKEEDFTQSKECNTIVERQIINKTKYHQKLSSTDGEILSKVDDDTRFSRPTDDHAHRSELNDEDDECQSEGDVFIEDSSVRNTTPCRQPSSNSTRRHSSQYSIDELPSERRWQWSKESGGLIDKGNRKKKHQSNTNLTCKNPDDEQVVYEIPQSEQIPTSESHTQTLKKKQSIIESNNESNNNKQILQSIINSMNDNDSEQPITDEFFDNGPHTNPEETLPNITSSA